MYIYTYIYIIGYYIYIHIYILGYFTWGVEQEYCTKPCTQFHSTLSYRARDLSPHMPCTGVNAQGGAEVRALPLTAPRGQTRTQVCAWVGSL